MSLSTSDDSGMERSLLSSRASMSALLNTASLVLLHVYLLDKEKDGDNSKKSQQSSNKRRCFDNVGCLATIKWDHLSPDALFGHAFPFFRLGRSRVELILQSSGYSDVPFYNTFHTNRFGLTGASLEAKVWLPLKNSGWGCTTRVC
jgi:hypothetical protein